MVYKIKRKTLTHTLYEGSHVSCVADKLSYSGSGVIHITKVSRYSKLSNCVKIMYLYIKVEHTRKFKDRTLRYFKVSKKILPGFKGKFALPFELVWATQNRDALAQSLWGTILDKF